MYEIQNLYLEHINVDFLKDFLEKCNKLKLIGYYAFILHDKDLCDDTDELKKPHFHLIIEWLELTARTTKNIIKTFNLYDEFKKCNIRVKYIHNIKKMNRYLTHKDDLEKYQYNDHDVVTNSLEDYKKFIYLVPP